MGYWMRNLSLIVAFHNDADRIARLASQLAPVVQRLRPRWGVELILIDDGSSDNSYRLIEQEFTQIGQVRVQLFRHWRPRGIGASLKTGFANATGDVVVTMDSSQYRPGDIPALIEILLVSDYDVVTVSPDRRQMRLGQRLANKVYRRVIGSKTSCYTEMLRVFRRDRVAFPLEIADDHLGVAESLIEMADAGNTILEFPVPSDDPQQRGSRWIALLETCDHLRLASRLLLARKLFGPRREVMGNVDENTDPHLLDARLLDSRLLSRWALVNRR